MRPFLPPLLAGALASGDAGLDFDGTGYAFLESPGFLAVILALTVVSYAVERWRRSRAGGPPGSLRGDPVALVVAAAAVSLGALLFAGSLSAGGEEPWPGLLAGAACAALGVLATSGLLDRVSRRLNASAAALLPAWADAAALALAALAILFPPAALLGLAALAYLLVAERRAREGKYEGLRILR